jgi:type II secretory pathway pseudopilin PulG
MTRPGRPPRRPNHDCGRTLVETLVALMLGVVMAGVSLPPLTRVARIAALNRAARHLTTLLMLTRAEAVLHHERRALVFEETDDGGWRCFRAIDGDGDGVHSDDIEGGRDPIIGEVLAVWKGDRPGLGILSGARIPDPGGHGWLKGDPGDPVRAGRADIITFTPAGTATPCSLYFSDRHDRMRVVRVLGSTGRVRSLRWQRGWTSWERVGF